MFSVNKANIEHLKRSIEAFGPHWLHGDGNIYLASKENADNIHPSDFHKQFTNPKPGNLQPSAASYRVLFRSAQSVPDDLDEITQMLLSAANKENAAEDKSSIKTNAVRVLVTPGAKTEPKAQVSGTDTATLSAKEDEIADLKKQLEELKSQKADVQPVVSAAATPTAKTDDEILTEEIAKEEALKGINTPAASQGKK